MSVISTDDTRRSPVAKRHEWDGTLPIGSGLRSDTVSQNNSFALPNNGSHNQFEQPEVSIHYYVLENKSIRY